MASLTRTSSLLALAGVLTAAPLALAQTQADFDVCNQQAEQTAAASPSASPRSVPSESITSSPGTSVGGSLMTAPGSADVNRMPNASGRLSGSAGSPGADVGTGTVAGGGTPATSPSPATSNDTALQGMAAAGQGNAGYQEAFRNCMKARGF